MANVGFYLISHVNQWYHFHGIPRVHPRCHNQLWYLLTFKFITYENKLQISSCHCFSHWQSQSQQIFLGKYYDFGSAGKLLMTNKGPVTTQGVEIKIKGITTTKDTEPRHIAWKYHNQEFVEFDMKDATPAMMFESYDLTNISRFNHKLVGTKVHKYYEMIDRYIIMIPTWLIGSFEEIGHKSSTDYTTPELYHNDDNPETVIEETSINSHTTDKFSYRGDANDLYMSEFAIEDSQSLQQWDSDNPDYS